MIRKTLRGQEENKKIMIKKSVDYLTSESLIEQLIELSERSKQATETKLSNAIRQVQQKQYETIFPNSLDYSNLTRPEMGIVSYIRIYRKKHGMSKFRNKEINERFINADFESKCSFTLEAIERIKNDEVMSANAKKYFVERLEAEKTKMLIELDDVQES